MPAEAGRFGVAVTYAPATTGPYLWHEFEAARVAADLRALRTMGFEQVRVNLAWDAFMPTWRQVSRPRIRDLEALLRAALDSGVRVTPVLFAQSHGDTLLLPAYAVDRRRPRPGVRVVSDQNLQTGGPRDLWADPLMLEVSVAWADAMVDAFGGHPAIAGWDLGQDPATTLRPRRIDDMVSWVSTLAGRVRARGERCLLTLGLDDVVTARAVRPALLAPHLDGLGLAIDGSRLPLGAAAGDPGAIEMWCRVLMRLASTGAEAPAVHVVTGVAATHEEAPPPVPGRAPRVPEVAPRWEVEPLLPETAGGRAASAVDRLVSAGAGGVCSAAWSDLAARVLAAPPFDRRPSLARRGMVGVDGETTPVGRALAAAARREPATGTPSPWPTALDPDDWYGSLPEAARDLADAYSEGAEKGEGLL